MQVESVGKIHVLVLEDDPDLQAPLTTMLERQPGFRVTATTTPISPSGKTLSARHPPRSVFVAVYCNFGYAMTAANPTMMTAAPTTSCNASVIISP